MGAIIEILFIVFVAVFLVALTACLIKLVLKFFRDMS